MGYSEHFRGFSFWRVINQPLIKNTNNYFTLLFSRNIPTLKLTVLKKKFQLIFQNLKEIKIWKKTEMNNEKTQESKSKHANYRYWVKDDENFYKGLEKPDTAPKKVTEHE